MAYLAKLASKPRAVNHKSWRGPANKLIWTVDDQRKALEHGFFVGVRIEMKTTDGWPEKRERACINRAFKGSLSHNLTKAQFVAMLNQGIDAGDAFWIKLGDFCLQQSTHGYVGAWDDRARSLMGMKNVTQAELFKRKQKIAAKDMRREQLSHA